MTAEGDNSVLMQKVSKELLAAVQNGSASLPSVADAANANSWDLSQLSSVTKMMHLRLNSLFKKA